MAVAGRMSMSWHWPNAVNDAMSRGQETERRHDHVELGFGSAVNFCLPLQRADTIQLGKYRAPVKV
jgi:hypothetical protein